MTTATHGSNVHAAHDEERVRWISALRGVGRGLARNENQIKPLQEVVISTKHEEIDDLVAAAAEFGARNARIQMQHEVL